MDKAEPVQNPAAQRELLPRARVWTVGIVACVLSGGLGAYAGTLVAAAYDWHRVVVQENIPTPGLETVGIIAGAVSGVLAGSLWVRRCLRVRRPEFSINRARDWGVELGVMSSLFIHAMVGPAHFLIRGSPISWGVIVGGAIVLGLTFGMIGGIVMGRVCGMLLKPREEAQADVLDASRKQGLGRLLWRGPEAAQRDISGR